MTVTIDENGCLIVMAETPLESYALTAWFAGFNKPSGEQTSVIRVCTLKTKDQDADGKRG